MKTAGIVLSEPQTVSLEAISLTPPASNDVAVDVTHSAISAGTERLLFTGEMPAFPGMGYPLVPGYETVGRVAESAHGFRVGDPVFVPGARCFQDVRALFGGAAAHLRVPADKLLAVGGASADQTLIALAATAQHAIAAGGAPQLVIGNGVLGRLVARLTVAAGAPMPTIHEIADSRRDGAVHPDDDPRRDYGTILDASGDPSVLDAAVARLAKGGTLTLAGFYGERVSFAFPAAFMKAARFVIAAEFTPDDMRAVREHLDAGRLSLAGLVTHSARPVDAAAAYRTAFFDPTCLKLVFNWSAR